MKLRSSLLLAVAIIAPVLTGVSLHAHSQSSFANEAAPKMEGHRGRWKQLSPEEREAKRAEKAAKMKEYLNLSDAQAEEIQAIREKYQPQRQALREEVKALRESGDRDGMQALRQKKTDLRQQIKAEMKTVLNSDQIEKLEELKALRGRRGRGFRGASSEG